VEDRGVSEKVGKKGGKRKSSCTLSLIKVRGRKKEGVKGIEDKTLRSLKCSDGQKKPGERVFQWPKGYNRI